MLPLIGVQEDYSCQAPVDPLRSVVFGKAPERDFQAGTDCKAFKVAFKSLGEAFTQLGVEKVAVLDRYKLSYLLSLLVEVLEFHVAEQVQVVAVKHRYSIIDVGHSQHSDVPEPSEVHDRLRH